MSNPEHRLPEGCQILEFDCTPPTLGQVKELAGDFSRRGGSEDGVKAFLDLTDASEEEKLVVLQEIQQAAMLDRFPHLRPPLE